MAQPTLQFAQRFEDGLGDSLNSIWGSAIDEDQDLYENTLPVENPEVGLSDTPNLENSDVGR